MKPLACTAVMLLATSMAFSQADSTKKSDVPDTIKVGNFIIIKKNKENTNSNDNGNGKRSTNVTINIHGGSKEKKKHSNVSTNYFILDLGFANFRDQTNYGAGGLAQTSGYLKQIGPGGKPDANSNGLISGKSSNVNLWLFMQKLNLYKHVVNLKYGLGLEMYNFRYNHSLSYRKDPSPYMFNDSVSFSKNKLFAEYLTVPFMVNVNTNPDKKRSFSFSAGVSAGYLFASRNKQISNERGKQKYKGDFNLNPWRLAAIGELGLGPVRLYGSYSFNALHKDMTGIEQYPYVVGVRFSNW